MAHLTLVLLPSITVTTLNEASKPEGHTVSASNRSTDALLNQILVKGVAGSFSAQTTVRPYGLVLFLHTRSLWLVQLACTLALR